MSRGCPDRLSSHAYPTVYTEQAARWGMAFCCPGERMHLLYLDMVPG
jgi:hypothetical protein